MRAELAEVELRMTKWAFICAIATVALAVLFALPTLSGAALAVLLAGTAGQMYAVWRM